MVYGLNDIARDAERFRRAVSGGEGYAPLYVKLKVIWKCNLRCGMCRHWRSRAEPPMATDRMIALIDDLARLGCRKLKFSGGEPLLHPDLPELVREASRRGLRVSLTTNGTLLTAELAGALGEAGLQRATVSIDAPEAALHDQMRDTEGAFAETLAGVRELARAMTGGRIHVNTVVGDLNYELMAAMPDMLADLGASSLKLISLKEVEGGLKRMTPEQVRDYNERIAPKVAERGLARGLFAEAGEAYPYGVVAEGPAGKGRIKKKGKGFYETMRCFAPFTHAMIEHDGIVKVCCMLRQEPVMGDLKTQSFREIWDGEAYRELRRRESLPLLPRCRFCHDFIGANRKLARLIDMPEPGRLKDRKSFWKKLKELF